MSEQFIKLHSWMTELDLSGNELIAFAVIHHYTAYQGGYADGALALAKWCGIAKSKVYRVIDKLIEKEYVVKLKASKGRNATVYASVINCPQTGQLGVPKGDSKLSPNGTVNCPHGGTLLDNRYIDTPYSPPKGDGANADATLEHKPRTRKRKNRGLDYEQGPKLTRDDLKALGISFGEEIYEGFDELRIE